MPTLYEINSIIDELLQSDAQREDSTIDGETGEIVSVEEMLDNLEIDQKVKFDNLGCWIKNLIADIDALKTEETKLAERRKAKENQAERLKNYLAMNLQMAGYQKFETPRCLLSFRKSKQVEIAEGTILPAEYVTTKITESPNKKALKEALESGEVIDGVSIVDKSNIQIK